VVQVVPALGGMRATQAAAGAGGDCGILPRARNCCSNCRRWLARQQPGGGRLLDSSIVGVDAGSLPPLLLLAAPAQLLLAQPPLRIPLLPLVLLLPPLLLRNQRKILRHLLMQALLLHSQGTTLRLLALPRQLGARLALPSFLLFLLPQLLCLQLATVCCL
jgi:hypothetical protein